jgi:hypothetical protein
MLNIVVKNKFLQGIGSNSPLLPKNNSQHYMLYILLSLYLNKFQLDISCKKMIFDMNMFLLGIYYKKMNYLVNMFQLGISSKKRLRFLKKFQLGK